MEPCIPVNGSTFSTVKPFRYLSAYACAAACAFSSVSEAAAVSPPVIPGHPVAPIIIGPIIPGPIVPGVGGDPAIWATATPATRAIASTRPAGIKNRVILLPPLSVTSPCLTGVLGRSVRRLGNDVSHFASS
jgi:hypothetical protein